MKTDQQILKQLEKDVGKKSNHYNKTSSEAAELDRKLPAQENPFMERILTRL